MTSKRLVNTLTIVIILLVICIILLEYQVYCISVNQEILFDSIGKLVEVSNIILDVIK